MNEIITDIIYFRRSLPFAPSRMQILYIEDEYHVGINTFIREHHDALRSAFARIGYDFCYLPLLPERINNVELIRYFTPYQSDIVQQASFTNDYLNTYVKRGTDLSPAFIWYNFDKTTTRYWTFSAVRLVGEEGNLHPFIESFIAYLKKEEKERYIYRFCCTTPICSISEEDEYADNNFSEEVHKLMEDVRCKLDKLRQSGVSEMALRTLLCPTIKLSRLQITASCCVLLPDYGNLEIRMTPLVKAVFFLFLRHPEGIVFKRLPDYRAELLAIYSHLTGRLSNEQVYQSIVDVTDPCKNSINEKCARIREAFIREFDEQLAGYYYVTGERGKAKRICLPRHLVVWENR